LDSSLDFYLSIWIYICDSKVDGIDPSMQSQFFSMKILSGDDFFSSGIFDIYCSKACFGWYV
jgi:hypothetical protein